MFLAPAADSSYAVGRPRPNLRANSAVIWRRFWSRFWREPFAALATWYRSLATAIACYSWIGAPRSS